MHVVWCITMGTPSPGTFFRGKRVFKKYKNLNGIASALYLNPHITYRVRPVFTLMVSSKDYQNNTMVISLDICLMVRDLLNMPRPAPNEYYDIPMHLVVSQVD